MQLPEGLVCLQLFPALQEIEPNASALLVKSARIVETPIGTTQKIGSAPHDTRVSKR